MGANPFWSPSRITIGRNWFTSGSSRSFQKRIDLEIFLVLPEEKMYLVHKRTKGRPKLLFYYLFKFQRLVL